MRAPLQKDPEVGQPSSVERLIPETIARSDDVGMYAHTPQFVAADLELAVRHRTGICTRTNRVLVIVEDPEIYIEGRTETIDERLDRAAALAADLNDFAVESDLGNDRRAVLPCGVL
jgi:hypothetical protein